MIYTLYQPADGGLNAVLVSENHWHIGCFWRREGRGPWAFRAAKAGDERDGTLVVGDLDAWIAGVNRTAAILPAD